MLVGDTLAVVVDVVDAGDMLVVTLVDVEKGDMLVVPKPLIRNKKP